MHACISEWTNKWTNWLSIYLYFQGDQDLIAPYNVNILPNRQVMRIKKFINQRIEAFCDTLQNSNSIVQQSITLIFQDMYSIKQEQFLYWYWGLYLLYFRCQVFVPYIPDCFKSSSSGCKPNSCTRYTTQTTKNYGIHSPSKQQQKRIYVYKYPQ